jgi:ammonia channel protein AmtB
MGKCSLSSFHSRSAYFFLPVSNKTCGSSLLQAFAATTATIVSGAVAERATFTAYMTVSLHTPASSPAM